MRDSAVSPETALADRYTIERELGAGGMATVYLADDLKHDRKVAVKVLRPELAAVLGAERFLQEIKVTANLQHPHILPLHDSGEADNFLYYVMPYVEGESLREKLDREKQLSIDDALKLTSQVADALGSAHRQGVVHRDIKPENILLSEGHALVADFGIALAVTSAGGERLTETGLSLGTPAYMSPEQVAGDREIDGRSDIYSLACVLYEMLAGEPPFTGPNPQAVLARHVTDPVPPITTVRSSVTQPVAAAIAKALGKAPVDRFESAKAFSEALVAEAAEAEPEIKSIVVLPFENLSPDPEQEYFSDGLTEEVISDLSKVHALRVISRSSAMTFKGSGKRIPDIAKELNVRYALEGSVRKAGNRLRITAQLIDAEDDAHVWADKFTGTLEDVFDMQENVSRAIVDALKVTLTPDEECGMAARPLDNVAVYERYLKAKTSSFEFTKEGALRALEHLEDGLRIAGDHEMLYAQMAFAYWQLVNIGAGQDEYLARAHDCIDMALRLDPECAEAYAVLGWIGHLEGDFAQAARDSKKALAIDPNNAFALGSLGAAYMIAGRSTAAAEVCEKLRELDPLDFSGQWMPVATALYDGQFDRAINLSRQVYERFPAVVYAPFTYALALIYGGEGKAAVPVMEKNALANPDNAVAKAGLVLRHAVQGETDKAYAELTSDFVKTAKRDGTIGHHLAAAFALLGEADEALNWLEAAIDADFINYPMLAEHDPLLANLRGDERFKKLMVRVKKEWEEFEE